MSRRSIISKMVGSNKARYAELQNLLKNLREEAGLRQIDLAESLGLPQSFISKYESGERRLDIIELENICKALGLTLRDFASRFEKK
jgi:transcriptional regulator with XRE-family HTH domain